VYNDEKNKDMNKKRYMAPQMEIMMVETQGFIASSKSLSRGKYNDSEEYESEMPTVNSNGTIFGD
jgi:hypothetical protein